MPREDYIPYDAWEDAEWRLVDSTWNIYEDEDYYRQPVTYYEGDSTLEVIVAGTPYRIELQWEFDPEKENEGLLDKSLFITYNKMEDETVPVYDDSPSVEDDDTGTSIFLGDAVAELLPDIIANFRDEMLPPPLDPEGIHTPDGDGYFKDDPAADYAYDPMRHDSPL